MGEVYRAARDTRLDRTVAIKILAQHLSSSALRDRFEHEARAIASLNHLTFAPSTTSGNTMESITW
jgi:serine/threonine-protein kinase